VQASPDGRLLAVGYSQGASDVLDARSELLRPEAPADPAVDFTPDGKNLVLDGACGEIVDQRTGRLVRRFPGFPAASVFNTCNSACFSASAGLRWLTYLDPTSASPRIREVQGETGRQIATVTVPRLDAQGVAPDGRIVAAYVDGDRLFASVIDAHTGRARDLPAGQSSDGCAATTPSFTPDSRLMAIVDGCIHVVVWDLRSARITRTIVLPDRASGSGAVLSPDGRYVLVTVLGGALVRVDLATGRSVERPGAETEGNALAVSPDGQFYAIGRQDGTVDVYDAPSLRPCATTRSSTESRGSPSLPTAASWRSRTRAMSSGSGIPAPCARTRLAWRRSPASEAYES
jgi:WD40 repeat protein